MKTREHSASIPLLFFTELWKRFGHCLVAGIFILSLEDVLQEFGINETGSAGLCGTFIALFFLAPFAGGLLAERLNGYSRSLYIVYRGAPQHVTLHSSPEDRNIIDKDL